MMCVDKMEKSFYISGGTVLGADWDQLKSKKINSEEYILLQLSIQISSF